MLPDPDRHSRKKYESVSWKLISICAELTKLSSVPDLSLASKPSPLQVTVSDRGTPISFAVLATTSRSFPLLVPSAFPKASFRALPTEVLISDIDRVEEVESMVMTPCGTGRATGTGFDVLRTGFIGGGTVWLRNQALVLALDQL